MKNHIFSGAAISAILLFGSALSVAENSDVPEPRVTHEEPSTQSAAARVVEAFVAPRSLFPAEGSFAGAGAAPYKPVPAYTGINGKLLGEVVLKRPVCPPASSGSASMDCPQAEVPYLVLKDGKQHTLEASEWSYDTLGLVTYKPSVVQGQTAWSPVEYPGGVFWIKTAVDEVHTVEQLAHLVYRFDSICTKLGKCGPLTAAMKQDIRLFDEDRAGAQTCYLEPYEVVKVVSFGGRQYYKVTLPERAAGSPKVSLPQTAYVPTRNKDGSHSGTFYSRGC